MKHGQDAFTFVCRRGRGVVEHQSGARARRPGQGRYFEGLTDGFSSNSWEQSAWNAWKAVRGQAVKDGMIADQKITIGDDDPAQQITQLQNLVLEGYDGTVTDAASPTALNGGIKEACDAGIVVVA